MSHACLDQSESHHCMNILILNVHSALNPGDDAIMHATLQSLAERYPNASITVAANDPSSWLKHGGIGVVGSFTTWVIDRRGGGWRWRKPLLPMYTGLLAFSALLYRFSHRRLLFGRPEQEALLQAYYGANLVLSCGGGNFYAHRALSPGFVWALLAVAFAVALGKKVVMLPQSIGPIAGAAQRLCARLVFNRVYRILVREGRSQAFLSALGVSKPDVTVLADLAFALPPVPEGASEFARRSGALRVGVTVIDRAAQDPSFPHQRRYEDAVVGTLIRLARERSVEVHLFVQCSGPTLDQDDRPATSRIYERVRSTSPNVMLAGPSSGPFELEKAYSRMDCMVGSRMHTGVHALRAAVPVVLMAYQPKAAGMMEMFGLERYCFDIASVTEQELYSVVCEVLARRGELKSQIAERHRHVRERLADWAAYLED